MFIILLIAPQLQLQLIEKHYLNIYISLVSFLTVTVAQIKHYRDYSLQVAYCHTLYVLVAHCAFNFARFDHDCVEYMASKHAPVLHQTFTCL